MERKLDGIFFRVKRNGKYKSICWSDLSEEEREEISKDKPIEWWKGMTKRLTEVIQTIGDEFDIMCDYLGE